MAKRTKEKPIKLTREKYQEIKRKLDQTDTEELLNKIYFQGYEKGQAVAGFDTDKALETISQIKGIGPGKLKEIERVLKGAANGNETQ